MKEYWLHQHVVPGGGVSFTCFMSFYKAMCSASTVIPPLHYSVLRFTFVDGMGVEYRMGHTPLTWHERGPPTRHAQCAEIPGRYVAIFDILPIQQPLCTSTMRANVLKEVVQVTIIEKWEFVTEERTYCLCKAGSGATKHLASLAPPRFHIIAQSDADECVYDLIGRFKCGVDIEPQLVFQPA